jgi:DNA-nicking Smr family endonuclease
MTAKGRKTLTEQDRAIWEAFVAPIRKLPGRPDPPPSLKLAAMADTMVASKPVAAPRLAISPTRLVPIVIGNPPGGLDRALWQRFRGGSLPVERRLDLHGHTAQHGFARFEQLIIASAAQGLRCIEVITGRGAGELGGVLRRELPLWLNLPHLRPLILAASHPHAGNTGSVRLLLRRASRASGLPRPRR